MKKCKSCKTEIDAKATKCPHCQTDQRGWFRRHPILTAILVLVIIGLIGSGASGGSKTSTTSKSTSNDQAKATAEQPTAAQAAPPMVVDATALVGEYDKNKLSAQDKYSGKMVQTTGFISNISQDITGNYFLSLNPSSEQYYFGTSIQCYFQDKSVLTPLSKKRSITVKGTMQDMSLGIVEMKDCSLVK